MDVEVVVEVLADAAQRLELGEDARRSRRGRRAAPARAADRGRRSAGAARRTGARPRARRACGAAGAGERDGLGLDLEAEFGAEPRRAQQPQRVVGESLGRRPRAGGRPSRSREAAGAGRSACVGSASVVAIALTVKSRPEVGLDRLAADSRHVDVPVAVRRYRPPGAELSRELERGAAGRLRDRLRDLLLVSRRRRGRRRRPRGRAAASRTAPPTIQALSLRRPPHGRLRRPSTPPGSSLTLARHPRARSRR